MHTQRVSYRDSPLSQPPLLRRDAAEIAPSQSHAPPVSAQPPLEKRPPRFGSKARTLARSARSHHLAVEPEPPELLEAGVPTGWRELDEISTVNPHTLYMGTHSGSPPHQDGLAAMTVCGFDSAKLHRMSAQLGHLVEAACPGPGRGAALHLGNAEMHEVAGAWGGVAGEIERLQQQASGSSSGVLAEEPEDQSAPAIMISPPSLPLASASDPNDRSLATSSAAEQDALSFTFVQEGSIGILLQAMESTAAPILIVGGLAEGSQASQYTIALSVRYAMSSVYRMYLTARVSTHTPFPVLFTT
jgi:hypothetical protein